MHTLIRININDVEMSFLDFVPFFVVKRLIYDCQVDGQLLSFFSPQVLLHVLFEHAAGYALFAIKEVEEIGMLLPQVGVFVNAYKCSFKIAFCPMYTLWSSYANHLSLKNAIYKMTYI